MTPPEPTERESRVDLASRRAPHLAGGALRARLIELLGDPALRPDQIRVARAPGRVNLIGEHTDYNEGFVLPVAIDREIRIAYVPTDDGTVDLTRLDTGERGTFALDRPRDRTGEWLDYVAGTAWALQGARLSVQGLHGIVATSLPMNVGLSSSAALELVAAHALLGPQAGHLDPLDLARLAQEAENAYVGVACGIMDQFASACGQPGSALLLDCRSLAWRPVRVPPEVAIVVCDTGSRRRLEASEYNVRRAECNAAARALAYFDSSVQTLRDVTPDLLAEVGGRLDPLLRRRAAHVVAENARVIETVEALEAGDLNAVGEAFAASHASLADLFDVSSSALDAMVSIARAAPGVIAARMTGAGFGGCAVVLCHREAVPGLTRAVQSDYVHETGLRPMVLEVDSSDGAGQLD